MGETPLLAGSGSSRHSPQYRNLSCPGAGSIIPSSIPVHNQYPLAALDPSPSPGGSCFQNREAFPIPSTSARRPGERSWSCLRSRTSRNPGATETLNAPRASHRRSIASTGRRRARSAARMGSSSTASRPPPSDGGCFLTAPWRPRWSLCSLGNSAGRVSQSRCSSTSSTAGARGVFRVHNSSRERMAASRCGRMSLGNAWTRGRLAMWNVLLP